MQLTPLSKYVNISSCFQQFTRNIFFAQFKNCRDFLKPVKESHLVL